MKLMSSYEAVRAFSKGSIWHDMQALLLERIEGVINEMLSETDVNTILRMQGEVSGLRAALGMVDLMLDMLKPKEE